MLFICYKQQKLTVSILGIDLLISLYTLSKMFVEDRHISFCLTSWEFPLFFSRNNIRGFLF